MRTFQRIELLYLPRVQDFAEIGLRPGHAFRCHFHRTGLLQILLMQINKFPDDTIWDTFIMLANHRHLLTRLSTVVHRPSGAKHRQWGAGVEILG